MNQAETLFARNDAMMRFIDTYAPYCAYDPCADAPGVAVCEVCGQTLASGDWQYKGHVGHRPVDYGCSECCAIGAEGELRDKATGEVVALADKFETRVLGEEGVA